MPVKLTGSLGPVLVAGAVGDALGYAFEGRPAGLPFSVPTRWRVSDDTWLTLATLEGLVAAGGRADPAAIAQGLCHMFQRRRIPGLGSTTLGALRSLAAGAHWAAAGLGGEWSAGNGAAMRIAPLFPLLDPERASERRTLRDIVRITHRHHEAWVAACAQVQALRWLSQGGGSATARGGGGGAAGLGAAGSAQGSRGGAGRALGVAHQRLRG